MAYIVKDDMNQVYVKEISGVNHHSIKHFFIDKTEFTFTSTFFANQWFNAYYCEQTTLMAGD